MATQIHLLSRSHLSYYRAKRIFFIYLLAILLPFSIQAQLESLSQPISLDQTSQLSYLYSDLPGTHTLTGSRIDFSELELRRSIFLDVGGQSFDVLSMLNVLFVDYVNSGGTFGVQASSFLLNNMDLFLDPSLLLGPGRKSRSGTWPVTPDKATIEHRDNMGRYFDVYFENKSKEKN